MAAVMADDKSEEGIDDSNFDSVPFSDDIDKPTFYIGEGKLLEDSLSTDSDEELQNDGEVDSLQFQYGVTPPRNARRLKEISKSCKKSKERSVVFSKSLSAKDLTTGAFNRAELDLQRKKNRANSTQITNERRFQRKFKRESWGPESSISPSNSFNVGTGYKMEIPSYMIESSNRYMCLKYDLSQSYPNARPTIRTVNTDPMSILSLEGKLDLNSAWTPEPRAKFFRTFSKLVEMCVRSKQKESPNVTQMERQTSEENKRWEVELRQALWLEIQAWHAGRTMEEQDEYLVQARKSVDDVLEEIINFRFSCASVSEREQTLIDDNDEKATQSYCCVDTKNEIKENKNKQIGLETPVKMENTFAIKSKNDEDLESLISDQGICSFGKSYGYEENKETTFRKIADRQSSCKETFSEIQVACEQVISLFDKLRAVEQLYPTLRALGEQNPKYVSDRFQDNFATLCVWLNVTQDLNHKLQTLAKILCIDINQETWKDWFDVGLGLHCPIMSKKDWCSTEIDLAREHINTGTPPKDRNEVDSSHSSLGRSSSTLSQHSFSSTSRYRPFVNKSIKKMGLIKLGQRIRDILDRSLLQANSALQVSCLQSEEVAEHLVKERAASIHKLETLLNRQESNSLSRKRSNSREWQKEMFAAIEGFGEDFQELGLPSFCNLYLFLARVPLDITHECLRLRLEHRPKGEPSSLSVRQLLRECKEVVLGAVLVKDYYLSLVEGIVLDKEKVENDLDEFEHDLQTVFKVYFDYLHNVLHLLQRMPEASKTLKNVLEEEWSFVTDRCQHIRGGEVEAGTRFCVMAAGLLDSTGHFLESGLDQACSELDSDFEHGEDQRRKVLETCRGIKNLFNEARERASKALGFQKKLRNDLETAASYHVEVSAFELLAQLEKTGHMQVMARHSAGLMMFAPKDISDDKSQIINLLNVCCGVEDAGQSSRCNGYLLLLSVETIECGTDTPSWEGEKVSINPNVETAIGLADIQVGGLILVVSNSTHLDKQCKLFQSAMKSVVQPVKKRTSKHQAIAETLEELQNACLSLREGIVSAIERVDENLDVDSMTDMDECERILLHQNYIETMHACFNFGFEYHKELNRIVSGESHEKFAIEMLAFARKWMTFVTTKCGIGVGFRPRWVHQGLEFLTLACDPNTVLSVLPEAEYQDLMIQMNDCIGHMKMGNAPHNPGLRPQSPLVTKSPPSLLRPGSWPANKAIKPDCESESLLHRHHSEPTRTPQVVQEAFDENEQEVEDASSDEESEILANSKESEQSQFYRMVPGESRLDSVRYALRKLENSRNQRLFDKRVIGQVTSRRRDIAGELANISNRRVPFKWQRGNKIGEGRFGKVYACVNLDSGDLMAMKQIKIHPNDHGEIRELADEIKNFEGIHHPSLVSYYGVELHRDEMFIFMEYCADGTIQDVAKLGLPEDMIRVYTVQILEAVNVLHEHGIVHRDVKGANIFLSSGGSLIKLGDFGSSIKLKDPVHTMHGEISNVRGTVAYMAPEVITMDKGAGYGRASDIWSLGCVVVEMKTGKPPWPECDNNFAVMYKVGEGETPAIPDTLSEEGKDFLKLCFTFDPRDRPSASELQDHPFVKCC